MSGSTHEMVMDRTTVNKNRLKLLAIFGVALLPVLLAFAMYFGGWAIPQDKTNKGNLLWPPVELNLLDRSSLSAQVALQEGEAKWSLMLTGAGVCNALCRERLHELRQVNIAMGREHERVGRVLAADLSATQWQELEQEYPALLGLRVDQQTLTQFTSEATSVGAQPVAGEAWQVWLVDPLGNVILQYTSAHDGYDMMDDLKRLLKLSKIG